MHFENIYFDISDIYKTLRDFLLHFICMKFIGVNNKNKHHVVSPDIPSVRKPVPHGLVILVPSVSKDIEIAEGSDTELVDTGTPAYNFQSPIRTDQCL